MRVLLEISFRQISPIMHLSRSSLGFYAAFDYPINPIPQLTCHSPISPRVRVGLSVPPASLHVHCSVYPEPYPNIRPGSQTQQLTNPHLSTCHVHVSDSSAQSSRPLSSPKRMIFCHVFREILFLLAYYIWDDSVPFNLNKIRIDTESSVFHSCSFK